MTPKLERQFSRNFEIYLLVRVLRDSEFRRATLECIRSGRCRLTEGLRLLGCDVWPSEANFLMIRLPEGYDASSCFEHLLQCGIIIRPLSSYGMPDKLRISIGTKEDNEAFLEALRSFFEKSF